MSFKNPSRYHAFSTINEQHFFTVSMGIALSSVFCIDLYQEISVLVRGDGINGSGGAVIVHREKLY